MAAYDVYRNPGQSAKATPYLLDVQSPLLHPLDTRVVVPLRRRDSFPADELPLNLMPVFEVEGMACIMETPKLAAVPRKMLKKPVASLSSRHAEIQGALDFLFQGF